MSKLSGVLHLWEELDLVKIFTLIQDAGPRELLVMKLVNVILDRLLFFFVPAANYLLLIFG